MELPVLDGERVRLRPLSDADIVPLRTMLALPGLAEWWGDVDPDDDSEILNEGKAFAIEVGDELAGWLGFSEGLDPQFKWAALDIMLAPEFQDRSLGSEALRVAIRWLIDERGHRRLTIDPAVANTRAVAAYAAIGFKSVGIMREYERTPDGGYRDCLLMDLLEHEFIEKRRG